jgi:hypothetical protein
MALLDTASTEPGACGGAKQKTVFSERKFADSSLDPNRQVNPVEFTKFDPVMKTGVPPATSPTFGISVPTDASV